MTEDQLRAYVTNVIKRNAQNPYVMSDYIDGDNRISDEDAERLHALVSSAIVTVTVSFQSLSEPTDHQTATEWAVIAYDVEKEADRVGICEDEADARELLAYQQRSMRLRDARIVTRNATPWLPFQTETEEQS